MKCWRILSRKTCCGNFLPSNLISSIFWIVDIIWNSMWMWRKVRRWINFIWKICFYFLQWILLICYLFYITDICLSYIFIDIILTFYVNLTIQTKLYLDVKFSDVDLHDARQKLFNFYDFFFIHNDLVEVDKIDFFKLKERIKSQRKSKKVVNSAVFANNFQFLEFSSSKDN